MRERLPAGPQRSHSLVDILDRVLDKGLVVAGDIKVSLADVELLTIRIRLIVCSIDKAQEIGLDWWRYDPHLSPGRSQLALENDALKKQIRQLERKVEALSKGEGTTQSRRKASRSAPRGKSTKREREG